MFNLGFEKIAVSTEGVHKLLQHNVKNNPHGAATLPRLNNSFKRINESVDKQKTSVGKTYVKRELLRKQISSFRKKQGIMSAKDFNTAKSKVHKETARRNLSVVPAKSKIPMILSSLGALGGAGYLAHKYLKKNQKTEAQVENNYKAQSHFKNDPAYSLKL